MVVASHAPMHVSKLMSAVVETVRSEDSMQHAARLMAEHGVGCLPVVDRDRRLTGIVTDRDICLRAASKDQPLSSISVAEAASRDIHFISTTDSVAKAERIMRRHQIRRLPVLDRDKRVAGVLSLNDIARAGAMAQWSGERGLSAGDVVETLAAICEPRQASRSTWSPPR
jgi:CBS domain-containing protein